MKELIIYEKEGYEGVYASLEISLFEYGLIWKKCDNNEWYFVYGVANNGANYTKYDCGTLEESKRLYEEWMNIKDVAECCGMSEKEWEKQTFPLKVNDLLVYYGYQDVFGDSYHPFEVIIKKRKQ